MKNKVILLSGAVLFLASGLMAARPGGARGEGVCAQDREKFCSEAAPGRGNAVKCLIEHKKELSKDCQARLENRNLKKQGNFAGKDGRKVKNNARFAQYRRGFREGFMTGWKNGLRGKEFKGKKTASAGACKEDRAKLCKDVKPGEGRVKACLLENEEKLSETCKSRVGKSRKN